MNLTVNGVEHELDGHGLRPLLHVLREELGITSPKAGCQQGGCGACTVLVDGEPRRSCLLPAAAVDGAEITTVEGIGSAGKLAPVQAAFHEHYGSQCGFCTPGFLLATHALIERSAKAGSASGAPGAGREQIEEALAGHTCRCTGYVKILEAIEAALRHDVGEVATTPEGGPPEVLIPGSPA